MEDRGKMLLAALLPNNNATTGSGYHLQMRRKALKNLATEPDTGFETSETTSVINELKTDKAPGSDEIYSPMIKEGRSLIAAELEAIHMQRLSETRGLPRLLENRYCCNNS